MNTASILVKAVAEFTCFVIGSALIITIFLSNLNFY